MAHCINVSTWFSFGGLFLCVGYFMIDINREIYYIIGLASIMLYMGFFSLFNLSKFRISFNTILFRIFNLSGIMEVNTWLVFKWYRDFYICGYCWFWVFTRIFLETLQF